MKVFSNSPYHVLLDVVEVLVLAALGELAAEDLLPVRAPDDLLHRCR
jgi:hypothetical protein